jgi:tRNA A37 methylthiotransferase MiaB
MLTAGETRRCPPVGRTPVVAVAGCVAQQEGSALLARSSQIDVIVGTQSLKQLPSLIAQATAETDSAPHIDINPYEDVSFPLGIARRFDPVKAYVTIIEGCNEFCSFCVVPYTRGHERMRRRRDILAEVTEAAASGRKEIQLLGQIVNHYQAPDDRTCDLAALLEAFTKYPASSGFDSRARIPGMCRCASSKPSAIFPRSASISIFPSSPGPTACSTPCGDATRARATSSWSPRCARWSQALS